jgi:environmental stress-induced protein Ves
MHSAGYQVFTIVDLPAQAWKNGGGTTRELASFGQTGQPFDCRFSIADIDGDGPFSGFAGYDRQMALVDGNGIRLHGTDIALRLAPGDDPIAFSGDVPVHASLLDGASRDFNVMTRRAACDARIELLHESAALRDAAGPLFAWCLLALRGNWTARLADGREVGLAAGQVAIGHDCGIHAVQSSDRSHAGPPALIAATVRSIGHRSLDHSKDKQQP